MYQLEFSLISVPLYERMYEINKEWQYNVYVDLFKELKDWCNPNLYYILLKNLAIVLTIFV